MYTNEKLAPPPPKNIGIATVIASISVSVAKLLVFPVLGTVCTSGLHRMLFSGVGRCRYLWKWIGHTRKLCHSRWHHGHISSRQQLITTSGFRPPSWIYKCCVKRGCRVRREKLWMKIIGISPLAGTAPEILRGESPPPPYLQRNKLWETHLQLARRVTEFNFGAVTFDDF